MENVLTSFDLTYVKKSMLSNLQFDVSNTDSDREVKVMVSSFKLM